ncbi:hypothetical protein BDW22DRAFT_1344178 [Trametopsis cervina]|nr:hypothetical protein BDW22DRAFT_1344178 [Trametopsis cervina]
MTTATRGKDMALIVAASDDSCIKNVKWDSSMHTDRIIEWMVNTPDSCMTLFPPNSKAVEAETGSKPPHIFERDGSKNVQQLLHHTDHELTQDLICNHLELQNIYIQARFPWSPNVDTIHEDSQQGRQRGDKAAALLFPQSTRFISQVETPSAHPHGVVNLNNDKLEFLLHRLNLLIINTFSLASGSAADAAVATVDPLGNPSMLTLSFSMVPFSSANPSNSSKFFHNPQDISTPSASQSSMLGRGCSLMLIYEPKSKSSNRKASPVDALATVMEGAKGELLITFQDTSAASTAAKEASKVAMYQTKLDAQAHAAE